MVPLRFVKIPPQGTERKCTRQEKKYKASEVRRLTIKAYTMTENFLNWWYINIYIYIYMPQENIILYLKILLLTDKKGIEEN